MIQPVYLPKLGETMSEATIERWLKAEGDEVKKGDVLLEITTDKATLEVESLVAGTLRKILAPESAVLPVNTVIALAGEPDDALPDNLAELEAVARGEKTSEAATAASPGAAPAAEAAEAASAPEVAEAAPVVAVAPGRIAVSPRARRRAKEEKVPLAVLRGSGANGRIIEKDVVAYLARRDQARPTAVAIAVAYERGVDITAVKGTGVGGRVSKAVSYTHLRAHET